MEKGNCRELVTAPRFAAIWHLSNMGLCRGLLVSPRGRKPRASAPPWVVPQLPGLPSPHEEAAACAAEPPLLSCRLVETRTPPGARHLAQGQEGEGMAVRARMPAAGIGAV